MDKSTNWVWKAGAGAIFIIGLAGLPDDLQTWWSWIVMLLDRGLLSWVFMIVGGASLIYLYRDVLLRPFEGIGNFQINLSNDLALTSKDILIIGGRLLLFVIPIGSAAFYFNIELPAIAYVSLYTAISMYLYLKRFEEIGKQKEKGEIIEKLKMIFWFCISILLLLLVTVTILEIVRAFRTHILLPLFN